MRSVLAWAAVRDYPLLHTFGQKTTERFGPGVTLADLPWDAIVRVVFTHAALATGVPYEGNVVDQQVYIEILQFHGLDTLAGLADHFERLALSSPAARQVMDLEINPRLLQDNKRPGGWLLDAVYTQHCIMMGNTVENLESLQFIVEQHSSLKALADHTFLLNRRQQGANETTVGHQVESLAWLALEVQLVSVLCPCFGWSGV